MAPRPGKFKAWLTLGPEVPLVLDEEELVVDGRQAGFGFHDDHAEHAVGDVVQDRRGAAVVHPDAGTVGGELVDEFPLDEVTTVGGTPGISVTPSPSPRAGGRGNELMNTVLVRVEGPRR
jgi:hypothetical protein